MHDAKYNINSEEGRFEDNMETSIELGRLLARLEPVLEDNGPLDPIDYEKYKQNLKYCRVLLAEEEEQASKDGDEQRVEDHRQGIAQLAELLRLRELVDIVVDSVSDDNVNKNEETPESTQQTSQDDALVETFQASPPISDNSTAIRQRNKTKEMNTTSSIAYQERRNESITNSLLELTSALKSTMSDISRALDEDRPLIDLAADRLGDNYGSMKKTGTRLKAYSKQSSTTTWMILGIVAGACGVIFLVLLLIKIS